MTCGVLVKAACLVVAAAVWPCLDLGPDNELSIRFLLCDAQHDFSNYILKVLREKWKFLLSRPACLAEHVECVFKHTTAEDLTLRGGVAHMLVQDCHAVEAKDEVMAVIMQYEQFSWQVGARAKLEAEAAVSRRDEDFSEDEASD